MLLALFGLLACIGARAATAQGDDPGLQRVAHFRLNDPVMAKYIKAQQALMQAAMSHPELEGEDDPGDAQTVDATIARLDRQPVLRAALASAGMSTTEYVLCSFALFQSSMYAWGVQSQGQKMWAKVPAGIPTENTRWVIAHKAELDKLKAMSGDGD